MTDESKPKVESLELNRETLQDLSEQEGDLARGEDGCLRPIHATGIATAPRTTAAAGREKSNLPASRSFQGGEGPLAMPGRRAVVSLPPQGSASIPAGMVTQPSTAEGVSAR